MGLISQRRGGIPGHFFTYLIDNECDGHVFCLFAVLLFAFCFLLFAFCFFRTRISSVIVQSAKGKEHQLIILNTLLPLLNSSIISIDGLSRYLGRNVDVFSNRLCISSSMMGR